MLSAYSLLRLTLNTEVIGIAGVVFVIGTVAYGAWSVVRSMKWSALSPLYTSFKSYASILSTSHYKPLLPYYDPIFAYH